MQNNGAGFNTNEPTFNQRWPLINWDDFALWSKTIADWGANYHKTLRNRPVRAQIGVGDIAAALPIAPPEQPQPMQDIMHDFDDIIMPGMTHWQHPRFFAYFNSNAAPPSMLAEQLANTVAANAMLWQTSPAATELEARVLDWLRQAVGLPAPFAGVIQDSASSATLAAVLKMRECTLEFTGNKTGLSNAPKLLIYCSSEVHSSIDTAMWIAGIGQDNLVKIPITDAPCAAWIPQPCAAQYMMIWQRTIALLASLPALAARRQAGAIL